MAQDRSRKLRKGGRKEGEFANCHLRNIHARRKFSPRRDIANHGRGFKAYDRIYNINKKKNIEVQLGDNETWIMRMIKEKNMLIKCCDYIARIYIGM